MSGMIVGSLHDGACKSADECVCNPLYIAKPTPKVRVPRPLKSKPHVIPWRIRQEVLDQYDFVCQWCEVPGGALDCHHVTPRSQGGRDVVGGLLPVHRICHSYIHANPSEAKARGFLA